jgi:hypothetical protein
MPGLRSSKPTWIRAAVALTILLSGFLSTGIDFLENHPAAVKEATGRHSEANDKPPAHIVSCKSETPALQCNACYFHKVVGQSLLAARKSVAVADVSIQHTNRLRVLVPVTIFAIDVNRSPPDHNPTIL